MCYVLQAQPTLITSMHTWNCSRTRRSTTSTTTITAISSSNSSGHSSTTTSSSSSSSSISGSKRGMNASHSPHSSCGHARQLAHCSLQLAAQGAAAAAAPDGGAAAGAAAGGYVWGEWGVAAAGGRGRARELLRASGSTPVGGGQGSGTERDTLTVVPTTAFTHRPAIPFDPCLLLCSSSHPPLLLPNALRILIPLLVFLRLPLACFTCLLIPLFILLLRLLLPLFSLRMAVIRCICTPTSPFIACACPVPIPILIPIPVFILTLPAPSRCIISPFSTSACNTTSPLFLLKRLRT
ncbi:unnamed protein product [Closterium sp. NIES-54]